MEWLNYHHLFYFWMAVRSGTISAAAEALHLTEGRISQLHSQAMGRMRTFLEDTHDEISVE